MEYHDEKIVAVNHPKIRLWEKKLNKKITRFAKVNTPKLSLM